MCVYNYPSIQTRKKSKSRAIAGSEKLGGGGREATKFPKTLVGAVDMLLQEKFKR